MGSKKNHFGNVNFMGDFSRSISFAFAHQHFLIICFANEASMLLFHLHSKILTEFLILQNCFFF